MAAATREGVEPELALAIDPLVPTTAFIDSLRALRDEFPYLPVSFSTEGLGGAERRLRSGEVALAFCILLPVVPEDVAALPLLDIDLVSVVAPSHPLALLGRAATRADLDEHIQLVLSDSSAPGGPGYGIMSSRTWRFVELGRRLEFLLAGLGWCRMPEPFVAPLLAGGQLLPLPIEEDLALSAGSLMIYASHLRNRPPGRAGAWLLDDLGKRFS